MNIEHIDEKPDMPQQNDQPFLSQNFPTVSEFFKQFTAYNIMPTSARALTIDSDTSIYRAFRIMGDNSVSSSYVWDRQTQLYTSVLTATDVMKASIIMHDNFFAENAKYDKQAFIQKYKIATDQEKIGIQDFLMHISIKSAKARSNLILTNTSTTLFEAINKMMERNVHRLPVIDNDGSIVLSLTYRNICRFLVSKFRFNSSVLRKTAIESNCANADIKTVTINDNLYTVIKTLVANSLSVVPVLDDDNKLYNVFSKYDFSIQANNGTIDLSKNIKEIIDSRPKYVEGCVTMPVTSTIGQILRVIADRNLHRMMLVDEHDTRKLVAVVSLRYVLKYLTQAEDVFDHRAVEEAKQEEIGSLKKSLEQNLQQENKINLDLNNAADTENCEHDGIVIHTATNNNQLEYEFVQNQKID